MVNLVLLLAAQAAAWHYLRTGRILVGAVATALLWSLLDGWLIAKFVYRLEQPPYAYLLVAFQAVAIATIALLAFGLWRRRYSGTARRRTEWFGKGLASYLRGEHAAAIAVFRRLVRCDPWDPAAWAALGNVLRSQGQVGAARRCYARALRVDRNGTHKDHVRQQLRRVEGSRGRRRG
ncbi:MAG: Tetratricopeptide repeat [Planctomycetota bacterium]